MLSRHIGRLVLGTIALAVADSAAAESKDVDALTATIDRRIAEKWAEARVEPAPRADDPEFLRRVCLDLAGKIPTVAEARDFLDDTAADKRGRLVESLLRGQAYVNHFTTTWRALLLPEGDAGNQAQFLAPDFEAWLRRKVAENAGHDEIARGIVALSLEDRSNGGRGIIPFQGPGQGQEPTPLVYYLAKEAKPENLAAGTARAFLGIRIECAQCHDHPFARWKREEFWGFAAFFGGIQKQGPADSFGPIRELPDRRELAIPGSQKVVQAGFLDGTGPRWRLKVGSRVTLAEWMTAPENPYFARAGVNRLWALLFGTGLVDPVDDLGEANPPSHPELLDELAAEFSAHNYDPKFLIRALTASRAYQLTSAANPGSTQLDPRLFAGMAVKALTPKQLLVSIVQAAGLAPELALAPRLNRPGLDDGGLLQKFSRRDEKPTEAPTSILQALAMMNGRLIAIATSLKEGPALGAIADAPFLDSAGKVETLFLATLARKPRPDERARLLEYLEGRRGEPSSPDFLDRIKTMASVVAGGAKPAEASPGDSIRARRGVRSGGPARRSPGSSAEDEALADIFWSLLNSSEFLLNH